MVMAIMISMVMAMVDTTGTKTLVVPMVAMAITMVMPMMVAMPSVFFHSWSSVCIRLCVCCTLLWGLSALMTAVPTYAFAVRIFDRTLDMAWTNDGVWK